MDLIVTCPRHFEPDAEREMREILARLGDPDIGVTITDMPGILTVRTALDPVDVVRGIREMLLDEPWSVRYSKRVIPVQRTVEPDVAKIAEAAAGLAGGIGEGETYRISVEKRNSDLSSREIITRIAGAIPNKVSLECPDRVVLVEILKWTAGVAVLRRSEILSVERTKRSISE